MTWSLAIRWTNIGGSTPAPSKSSLAFTLSATNTCHLAQLVMQVVLPDAHGSMTAALLELPTRLAPSHTTATCPLASALTHGNTFALPTVAPWLTTIAGVHVVPSSRDEEKKMFLLSDQTAWTYPKSSTAMEGKMLLFAEPTGPVKIL